MFTLSHQRDSDVLAVHVVGRIDGSNASDFLESIKSAVEDDDRVLLVELAGLSYISSAGLRSFLILAQECDQKGKVFRLCNLSSNVADVFRVSGFDKIIEIYSSVDEARQIDD